LQFELLVVIEIDSHYLLVIAGTHTHIEFDSSIGCLVKAAPLRVAWVKIAKVLMAQVMAQIAK